MNRPKMASPTFMFRETAKTELPEIIKKIAALGFDGVEFVGFFGWDEKEVQRMLKEYGLLPAGNNMPIYDIMENMEDVVALHKEMGFFSLTAGNLKEEHLPGGEYFPETAEWLTRLGTACREAGIRLLYHNHAAELKNKVEGRTQLELLLEAVPEEALGLQPDLGWMQIGGADPIAWLKTYVNRCPMIHVKDFFATDWSKIGDPFDLEGKRGGEERGFFEFRPTGYGVSNVPSQLPYIMACRPQWVVTCQDTCYERDRFEDLRLGLHYMKRLFDIHK